MRAVLFWLLGLLGVLSVDPSDSLARKGGNELFSLYQEYNSTLVEDPTQIIPTPVWTPALRVVDGRVPVEIVASGSLAELVEVLMEEYAFEYVAQRRQVVAGTLPLENLPIVADLPGVKAFQSTLYTLNAEAIEALKIDELRASMPNLDGSGVRIGVLSDSFGCMGSLSGVTVIKEGGCPATDEGRAMIELIRDIAPAASVFFATAQGGQVAFADNIRALADAGCQVMVDDINYLLAPGFMDGVVAQAIDEVVAEGIVYFSAAGNYGTQSYEAEFQTSGQTNSFGQLHTWATGTTRLEIPLRGTGALVNIVILWDQPFFSTTGGAEAESDLDLVLYDSSGAVVTSSTRDSTVTGDAVDMASFSTLPLGEEAMFGLEVVLTEGPPPNLFKIFVFDTNDSGAFAAVTNDVFSTIYGHPNAEGAISVAASSSYTFPEEPRDPPVVASYSARGGLQILLDVDGSRLPSPIARQQPVITGPDAISTSFFGDQVPGFPNLLFFGTSAAAPNVAAVAVLMLQANPIITPSDIRSVLSSTAEDMDDPDFPGFQTSFDFRTGFGFVDAVAAVNAALEITRAPTLAPVQSPPVAPTAPSVPSPTPPSPTQPSPTTPSPPSPANPSPPSPSVPSPTTPTRPNQPIFTPPDNLPSRPSSPSGGDGFFDVSMVVERKPRGGKFRGKDCPKGRSKGALFRLFH